MAVDTLGEQVVLAGPAPDPSDRVGDQGPVAVAASVLPLPGSAVTALVDAIPGTTLIDPTLKQAAALAPPQPKLPADINPALDVSLLNLSIVFMILWLGWLSMRPAQDRKSTRLNSSHSCAYRMPSSASNTNRPIRLLVCH